MPVKFDNAIGQTTFQSLPSASMKTIWKHSHFRQLSNPSQDMLYAHPTFKQHQQLLYYPINLMVLCDN